MASYLRRGPCKYLAAAAAMLIGAVACSNPQTAARQSLTIDEQVSLAKEGLAEQLGVNADDVTIDAVRAVHWRSGAIGCPKPGMSYTMAIVPGVQIILEVDGKIYRYHAERERMPFYCPADRAEAPALGQGEEVM